MYSEEKDKLEQLIDLHGLTAVVDVICGICYAKAEHIRASYQDEALAKQWEESAYSLVNPSEKYKDVDFPT